MEKETEKAKTFKTASQSFPSVLTLLYYHILYKYNILYKYKEPVLAPPGREERPEGDASGRRRISVDHPKKGWIGVALGRSQNFYNVIHKLEGCI